MCLHKLQLKIKLHLFQRDWDYRLFISYLQFRYRYKTILEITRLVRLVNFRHCWEKNRTEAFCSILEAARTATVPKMVRVAFGSYGREKAVQLAIRAIFDIVPHFKTQVGASIL